MQTVLRHPSVDGVLLIHEEIMRRMAEASSGFLYKGGVPYCVETARDLYNDPNPAVALTWKAAYYIWCLITNHPFIDGNKRTAFQTAEVFLRGNGYKMSGIEPHEVVTLLAGVATGQTRLEDLVPWIGKHLRSSEGT